MIKINPKVLLFLIIAVATTACAGNNNSDYPVKGFNLMCRGNDKTQEVNLLVFDSAVWMDGGAGYTLGLEQVPSDSGTKYERDDFALALWNKDDKWTLFVAENPRTPKQKLYTGNNAMECEIIREYNKKQSDAIYEDIPWVREKFD